MLDEYISKRKKKLPNGVFITIIIIIDFILFNININLLILILFIHYILYQ